MLRGYIPRKSSACSIAFGLLTMTAKSNGPGKNAEILKLKNRLSESRSPYVSFYDFLVPMLPNPVFRAS